MGGDGVVNSDPFIFTGKDGTECEDWIQSIQREAFLRGKSNDKEWMASLASTRLSGAALRWYCAQSESTTSDWFQLRAAFLNEYGHEPVGREPVAETWRESPSPVPTPAAAPPRSTYASNRAIIPAKSSLTAHSDVWENASGSASSALTRPTNSSTAFSRISAILANTDLGPTFPNSGSQSTGAPVQPASPKAEIQSIAWARLSERMNRFSSSASSQPVVSTAMTSYSNTAQSPYTGGYIKIRYWSGPTVWETYLGSTDQGDLVPSTGSNSGPFFQFDLGSYEYACSVSAFGWGPLCLGWNSPSYPNDPPTAILTGRSLRLWEFESTSHFYVKASSLRSGNFEVYHGTTHERLYPVVWGSSLIFTSNPQLYKLCRAYQNVYDAELIYLPMNE